MDGPRAMHVANAEIVERGEQDFAVERTSGEIELIMALGSLWEVANT